MNYLKQQIMKAVNDSKDIVDGNVSHIILDHFLDGILSKHMPEFTLEQITIALKAQWVKDFGKEMEEDTEIDGYFLCGMVHQALKSIPSNGSDFCVIKTMNGSRVLYYSMESIKSESDSFKEEDLSFASRFKTHADALAVIQEGRDKYGWGGIYQIDRIYISR